jgi:hypothetical protein
VHENKNLFKNRKGHAADHLAVIKAVKSELKLRNQAACEKEMIS